MAEELEQQLTDFLLTNRDYNHQFASDLINILKCHLGEHVKESINYATTPECHSYYCMTDNFILYAHSISKPYEPQIEIAYGLKKFSVGSLNSEYRPVFHATTNTNIKYIMRDIFNGGYFVSFMSGLSLLYNKKIDDVNIKWLFTRIPTKSARN